MVKTRLTHLVIAVVVLFSSFMLTFAHSSAATFNQNRIIDDSIFNNSAAMTGSQIDTFLNQFSGSCLSLNHGFSAPDPTGYSPSGGYTYGGNVSGGQVIYDAAAAYGLNPQVLLATLQKEQSLVTGPSGGCVGLSYAGATGYGCPDSGTTHDYTNVNLYSINGVEVTSINGTCVNSASKVGFSQQVIHAAWLLKFGEQRSEGNIGWNVQLSNAPQAGDHWDNSDDPQSCYGGPMTQVNAQVCPGGTTTSYDGQRTIDGASVHMDDGATASLYWYTPHFSGNQNFFNIFTQWFGNTLGTYSWYTTGYKILDQTGTYYVDPGQLQAGQKYLVDLAATNIGDATWLNNGFNPVRLATTNPQGHGSVLCDSSWITCSRPVSLREASVAPGQVGHFDFIIQAPYSPGSYRDYFKPLAESFVWMNNSDQSLGINVIYPGTYSWYTTGYKVLDQTGSFYVDPGQLHPNTQYLVDMAATNTGTATWLNNGPTPVRLATTNPQGHGSVLCDSSWITCSRPVSLREASVAPGQVGHFDFIIKTPGTLGNYRDYFKPLAENYSWMSDSNQSLGINVQ
jgi:hypothetical protein